MDALECLPSDELFTHTDTDGTVRHFNTTAMARAIASRKLRPNYATVGLYQELVEVLLKNHGVEEENLKRILYDNDRLAVPIFVALFRDRPDDYTTLVIDGAHRVVARWRRGLRTIDALFFEPEQWEPFLVTGFDVPHRIGDHVITPVNPDECDKLRAAGLLPKTAPNRVKF